MESLNETDFKHRLMPQTETLVAMATQGSNSPLLVEALIDACLMLEKSSKTDTPLVALHHCEMIGHFFLT